MRLRMTNPYETAVKKLSSDKRSLNELERETGIPSETLRDIKSGHVKSPRFITVKKLAAFYAKVA